MECWAHDLGDCAGGKSGEHPVTAALFATPTVLVKGFHWCPDKHQEIGVASLTANILCRSHNSRLSPLDEAAKRTFETIQEVTRLERERALIASRHLPVVEHSIAGVALEGWFLKTTINLLNVGGSNQQWAFQRAPANRPPMLFLRCLFAVDTLQPPMGLYFAAKVGAQLHIQDRIGSDVLLDQQGRLVASTFEFRGYCFMLWLSEEPLPSNSMWDPNAPPHWSGAELKHHMKELKITRGKHLSQVITFAW